MSTTRSLRIGWALGIVFAGATVQAQMITAARRTEPTPVRRASAIPGRVFPKEGPRRAQAISARSERPAGMGRLDAVPVPLFLIGSGVTYPGPMADDPRTTYPRHRYQNESPPRVPVGFARGVPPGYGGVPRPAANAWAAPSPRSSPGYGPMLAPIAFGLNFGNGGFGGNGNGGFALFGLR